MEGKEVIVTFIVVNSFSPYTAILGRPWIHVMGAIPSTLHMKVKFRTEQGVATIRGNQKVARQCLVAAAHWRDEQTKEREGLPVLRDWKRLRYYLIQTGIFKLGQA